MLGQYVLILDEVHAVDEDQTYRLVLAQEWVEAPRAEIELNHVHAWHHKEILHN